MYFADTHCHLDFPAFDQDRVEVIQQCHALNISRLIVPGVTRERWVRLLELSEVYPIMAPAIGLHPYFVDQHSVNDLEVMSELLSQRNDIIAVGEAGLDATIGNMAFQIQLLEMQIGVANHFRLPLIMHSRQTHPQLLAVLKKTPLQVGGVIHGFSGSYEQAMEFWQQGVYLGCGGVITYDRANKTRRAFSRLPLESVVIETDSPDMPPCGKQGERNTPLNILHIQKAFCALRPEESQGINRQLIKNTLNLFPLLDR